MVSHITKANITDEPIINQIAQFLCSLVVMAKNVALHEDSGQMSKLINNSS